MDEREIEAPHEGCLERACECVQDEMASLRRLNQVLAPRYPIVNVPVDTLDAISKRAEDAEAALDRVRDARGDDEAAVWRSMLDRIRIHGASGLWSGEDCAIGAVAALEGGDAGRAFMLEREAARSPQNEDHGRDARGDDEPGLTFIYGHLPPVPSRDGTVAAEAKAALWYDALAEAIAERDEARAALAVAELYVRENRVKGRDAVQDHARVRAALSRDGTVAVEDVARAAARDAVLRIGERVMTFGGFQRTPRGEFWIARDDVIRLLDELVTEFSRSSSGRPGQPGPDVLGGENTDGG